MSDARLGRAFALGAAVGLSALALWRCRPAQQPAATSEPISAQPKPAADSSPPVATPAASPAASNHALAEPAPMSDPATPAPSASLNTVQQVLAQTDPVDLNLYASIERETRRDIPRAVRDLVAKRRAGATRAQLSSEIQANIQNGHLRGLLARWLEEAFDGQRKPIAAPATAGSGPPLVRPLSKAGSKTGP